MNLREDFYRTVILNWLIKFIDKYLQIIREAHDSNYTTFLKRHRILNESVRQEFESSLTSRKLDVWTHHDDIGHYKAWCDYCMTHGYEFYIYTPGEELTESSALVSRLNSFLKLKFPKVNNSKIIDVEGKNSSDFLDIETKSESVTNLDLRASRV